MHALLLLSLSLVPAADADKDAAIKKELARFKGTWTVVDALRDGREVDRIKDDKITFDGENLTIKTKQGEEKAAIKIDPTVKPRLIDIIPTGGNDAGMTMEGIYELEGDSLKICICRPNAKARPAAFESKEGSNLMLVNLKRDK